MKATEREIQQAIQQAFKLKFRLTLWHIDAGQAGMRSTGRRQHSSIPKGFPDLLGVYKGGRAVFIEVKRPGGAFRPGQLEFLESMRSQGAIALWADSVGSAIKQFEDASSSEVSPSSTNKTPRDQPGQCA